MKANLNYLLLLSVLCSNQICSQESIPDKKKSQDTTFIKSFRVHPHLTFEFARRVQTIEIRSPKNDLTYIRYAPNSLFNLVASFDYRWLSVSLGLLKIPADVDNGQTNQFSLRASFNGRRIWNTNFLQVYQGYYLQNPDQIDPSGELAKSNLRVRPDISSITLFSNLAYCFNPEKFSYRAALWQLDRQEKSAGSFVAGASYRLNIMLSDSSTGMIPKQLEQDFEPGRRLVSQRLSNLTFHGGYIHTFVFKKYWFITLYLLPGISTQGGTYLAEDGLVRKNSNRITVANEFRFIAGYNADAWFTGLSTHTLSFSGNRRLEIWVDNNYTWFRVFAGFRFRAPGPRKHSFWKIFDL
jgi:hypothetical protein